MTAAQVPVPQYGGLFRALAFVLGLLLLAESVSQLVLAASSLEQAVPNWRVAILRLLFTQVTPLTLGLLLTGQYLVRSESAWRRVGLVAMMLGAVVAALAVVYLRDAGDVGSPMSGAGLGQARRTTVQVLLSAGAFSLALLLAGVLALRAGRVPQ
jgi:uncharacterized membrane protein YozB (DUF420 family)